MGIVDLFGRFATGERRPETGAPEGAERKETRDERQETGAPGGAENGDRSAFGAVTSDQ